VPVTTLDFSRRLERVMGEAHRRVMRCSMRTDDNPEGIAFFQIGPCRAMLAARSPFAAWMHEVFGMEYGPKDVQYLDAVLDFYRQHRAAPRVRIVPDGFNAAFANAMQNRGLRHFGFDSVLYGTPEPDFATPAPGVEIVLCQDIEDARLAMRSIIEGHVHRPDVAAQMETVRRNWHDLSGVHTYLAMLDGEPAGGAMMVIEDEIAYLMMAAVRPACRRRGVQTALIRARMNDAVNAGCRTVLACCGFGTSSQANMERAGLRIAYTTALWGPYKPLAASA
jgi:GNAT superfamily N-acetyltransferase